MNGHSDNTWICISDLFAGLMAFFVFVSVGILTNAESSSGDIEAKPEAKVVKVAVDPTPEPGNDDTKSDPSHIRYIANGLVLDSAVFENDSARINAGCKRVLDSLADKLADIIKKNAKKKKILFTGHSSCRCKEMSDDPYENYIKAYTYNMELSLTRAAVICRRMKRSGVLDSFVEADIRFRGMSEDMAASTQEGNQCVDRMRDHDEESAFRIVAIELYEEWPTLPMPDYMKEKPDGSDNQMEKKTMSEPAVDSST